MLFDDFRKISSTSKDSSQHNSLPTRVIDNLHKSSRLSCSLDHGLDKWDNNEVESQNGSTAVSHYGDQSSDSAEQYCSARSSSEIEHAECEISEDQSREIDLGSMAACGTKSEEVDSS